EVGAGEVAAAPVTARAAAEVTAAVLGGVRRGGEHRAEHGADQEAGEQAAAEVAAGPGAVRRARLPVRAAVAVAHVDRTAHRVLAPAQPDLVRTADRDLAGRAAGRGPHDLRDRGAVARVEEARR